MTTTPAPAGREHPSFADSSATIARRRLLALAGGTAAAGAVALTAAPVLAAVHPDAEILDLFRQWCVAESKYDSLDGARDWDEDYPEAMAIMKETGVLIRRIAACKPQTFEGLAVQVYVAAHCVWSSPAGGRDTDIRVPEIDMSGPYDEITERAVVASVFRLLGERAAALGSGAAA